MLELILVLALVAGVLTLSMPWLRGFCRSRETADSATRVLALTQYARSQAVAEGRRYRLCLDPDAGACWLKAQQAGVFVDSEQEMGRPFRLPVGTSVRLAGGAPGEADSPPYVQFYPDGRADVACIEIVGASGQVYQVACESATERFRVRKPSEVGRS